MHIGSLIRNRRKELRLTQKDLAQGICTQALISKIEREELNPSINMVYRLSERLQVPLSYFDVESNTMGVRYKNTEQLIGILRRQLERREYSAAAYLIQTNKKVIQTTVSSDDYVFFEWIQGILYYYLDRDIKKSIDKLTNIQLLNSQNPFIVEIYTSIGVLYYEEKKFNKARIFFEKAVNHLTENISQKIKAKLYFNYSLCLKELNCIEEALQLLIEGITDLVEENSLYLLGDFFYQKAICLKELDENEKAYNDLETAITVFRLQKNDLFETRAKIELKALKNK